MKKNLLFTCIILVGLMSSCGVYSLYPIFTADTVVRKDEVIGKWVSADSDKDYIRFSSVRYTIGNAIKQAVSEDKEAKVDMKISFSSDDGSVVDTGDYVIEKGDTIVWKDTLRTQLNNLVKIKIDDLEHFKVPENKKKDDYYVMDFYENSEKVSSFKAHFVEIGDNLFMDLYPQGGLDDNNGASENYFPVHTFLKVQLTEERLELKVFDQDKLKDLFESNLIRIRHEIIDDKVLITAQPKEIQKFLDKYSDDESVFEESAMYAKATP